LLVLPFLSIVAAFGIAPDTVTDTVPRQQVVEQLALPNLAPVDSTTAGYWREERVLRDDTLGALLARLGVDDPDALRQLRAERPARAIYQLAPGRTMRAQVTAEGKLLALRYLNGNTVFRIDRRGESFAVSQQPVQLERRIQMGSGQIRSSL